MSLTPACDLCRPAADPCLEAGLIVTISVWLWEFEMADSKGVIDVFGSYLARLNDSPDVEQAPAQDGAPEIAVLKALMISSGPVAIKTLMPILKVAPSLLMKAVDSLQEAKLVEVSRTDTDECVSITELGRRIAG